ncbi:hypothetical protein FRB96_002571 [Tulasnella sp. 330]|nr:hypothetical protein FRB96_002571 [Tulasnella sp. 330]KAG8873130.1 hypothetical protein FRB97_006999 [Tulasnella sp. 331]KAG8886800.1 hypothetical protein FRB98_000982 [Tulasnella sp. 332]
MSTLDTTMPQQSIKMTNLSNVPITPVNEQPRPNSIMNADIFVREPEVPVPMSDESEVDLESGSKRMGPAMRLRGGLSWFFCFPCNARAASASAAVANATRAITRY